jgi:post-segregation antitoxin (ccd killing protein)
MPNRTIYLPDELDELSRRLGLNLSHLTQRAIEELVAANADDALMARIDAASARAAALGLRWPDDNLSQQREEAGER